MKTIVVSTEKDEVIISIKLPEFLKDMPQEVEETLKRGIAGMLLGLLATLYYPSLLPRYFSKQSTLVNDMENALVASGKGGS